MQGKVTGRSMLLCLTIFVRSCMHVQAGHDQRVNSISWNCAGTTLASGSADSTIKLWQVDKSGGCREIKELKGHTRSVERTAWHPKDATQLVSVSDDKTLRFWDAKAGRCIKTIQTSGGLINLAFSPNGSQIVSGDKTDVLTLFDARKMAIVDRINFHDFIGTEVNEFGWDKSGSYLFLSTGCAVQGKSTIQIVDTRNNKFDRVYTLPATTATCYCIAFDPLGRYFALGSGDALVTLWDSKELVTVASLEQSDSSISAMCFSNSGNVLAYGSNDKRIFLENVETCEPLGVIDASAVDQVTCIAWNPKQNIVAYCGEELKGTRGGFVRVVGEHFSSK
mmetsp:Transcript_39233/g.63719  ORF Transcript_39233/g.63719 Transcript_39233/m.63719 type:complete len:336 (+) Transcript_39233:119-1126(+)